MTLARLLKAIDTAHVKERNDAQHVEELWKEFGASVREARRDNGVGLKEFSSRLGISRAMVGFLESGKRQWNFEMARKAVKLLGNGK